MLRGQRIRAFRYAGLFNPQSLFSSGAQGWLFDNSRLDTIFQDAAGTTPGALEAPVGKQLDLSGRGNHRSQSTGANRPTLSALYNLLTKTEDFTVSPWTKSAGVTSVTATAAPDGTNTAGVVLLASGTGSHQFYQKSAVNSTTITNRIIASAGTVSWLGLGFDANVQSDGAFFNLSNGTIGTIAAGTTATIAPYSVAGWYVCTITRTYTSNLHYCTIEPHTADNQSSTFSAAGTETIKVWHPDQRPSDQATGLIPTYQRVDTVSAGGYDTNGFPVYIKYNGSNQYLSTAAIDLTGTAKATIWTGVRKLSDPAAAVYTEFSTVSDSSNGSFGLSTSGATLATFQLRGTSLGYYQPAIIASPKTFTAAAQFDLSAGSRATQLIPYLNGTLSQTGGGGADPIGSSNLGNYAAYFGMRAGSAYPFNGYEFSNVMVGSSVTAAQLAATNAWTQQKSAAY